MGPRTETEVTVVGGGIAGLVAAAELAEAGVAVRLLEVRRRAGGRAGTHADPWRANLGPHALYTGTALWDWLRVRGLHGPARMPASPRIALRWEGAVTTVPPRALRRAIVGLRGVEAPVDRDLRGWATDRWGPEVARAMAGAASALTFDHDPGRLSAAFVVERIRRILLRPVPAARYVDGGWSALVDRLVGHARRAGVALDLDARVDAGDLDDVRRRGPVIVAVGPSAARRLLGDDAAPDDERRVALLDVGLVRRRRTPYLVVDLDGPSFTTRPSAVLGSVAPSGHDLLQMSAGMCPGEDLDAAEARLEGVLDDAVDGWRDRTVWRQRSAPRAATGAVDLPGTTWRDRPPVERGDGLWVAGDWVAAPGHLAEVSANSGAQAAAGAIAAIGARASVGRPTVSP